MRTSIIVGVILAVLIIASVVYFMIEYHRTTSTTTTTTSKPLRIVSLAPSDTQILIALGLGKYIVGMDIYSYQLLKDLNETNLVPSNVTVFSAICPPNISGILLLHPTVVLVEYGLDAHYIPEMEKAGIPLLITNMDYAISLQQIEEEILTIAKELNESQVGMEVVNWMKSHTQTYSPSVNVTYLDWICPNGEAYTAGGNVFINNVIKLAGGVNVFSNLSGYPLVSPSKILTSYPSVIIAQSVYNYSYTMSLIKEYYGDTPAFKDGRVYIISGLAVDLIDEPSVLSVYAVTLIHDILIGKAPHYINTTWVLENINVTLPVF